MRFQRYPDGGRAWTWFVWGRHPRGSLTWTHSVTVSRLRSLDGMKWVNWWSTYGQQSHAGVQIGPFEVSIHRQTAMPVR